MEKIAQICREQMALLEEQEAMLPLMQAVDTDFIVILLRSDIRSYRQLPVMLYQFANKAEQAF